MNDTGPEPQSSGLRVTPSTRDQTAVLGGVLWLCRKSTLHQYYPVGMLLQRIVPAIEIGQFRYYETTQGVPIGFCNWAYLSDPLLDAALHHNLVFEQSHWRSGPHIFVPELLAPFGHCRHVVRDLRTNVAPPRQTIWSVRGAVAFGSDPAKGRVQRFLTR
ncbi:cytolysin-activating lysine-acyltransferase [Hoeflea marina]|uniref:RTX toxin-activating lysine-acyltransferase n=1 Tax=Hoeflea marina TaxID=274592 RepID=A0A317PQF4_9HYPH|nr:toxin-activating lysine-acyltransferase [Hoeflea marina]PWW03692.1 cytolysin-activating lysine-acyltransferase [Hoeflea marina]